MDFPRTFIFGQTNGKPEFIMKYVKAYILPVGHLSHIFPLVQTVIQGTGCKPKSRSGTHCTEFGGSRRFIHHGDTMTLYD